MAYRAYGDLVEVRRRLGAAGLRASVELSPLGTSISVRIHKGRSSRFLSITLPKYSDAYELYDPGFAASSAEFGTIEEAAQEIVNRVQQEGERGGR